MIAGVAAENEGGVRTDWMWCDAQKGRRLPVVKKFLVSQH
jgi:hypothetical protein